MVPLWNCAIQACPKPAAIDLGGCERCRSMYCASHIRSIEHSCETGYIDDDLWLEYQLSELTALREKTNHDALLRRASQLRGGLVCRLDEKDTLGRARMGGMHVHLRIVFNDGVTWLARIVRENYKSFPNKLTNSILLSECATLKWLQSTTVPAPAIYGYGLCGDPENDVGVAYMLIEELPGQPFNPTLASAEGKNKVFAQWAEVLLTLRNYPFNQLGSLTFNANGEIDVGPVSCDRTGTLPLIGPFLEAKNLYGSWASAYRELISDGQLFSSYPIDAYLIFSFLEKEIRSGGWLERWGKLNTGPFYLKHMDDKGDHILVDDEYGITGIIDWTFTRVVPAYEAFAPSLMSADNQSLFSGKVGLSDDDMVLGQMLRRLQPTHCFFESDEMRRLLLGIGTGLGFTRDEAVASFKAILTTFGGAQISWQEWRETALAGWAHEPSLQDLLQANNSGSQPQEEGARNTVAPRFATCSFSGCARPSVRGRSCATCARHICAVHRLPTHHTCPSTSQMDDATWELNINSEVEALLARVNIPELVQTASALRDGKKCKFTPGKHLGRGAIMGCANYHAWIHFDDGVVWLARIPRVTSFSDLPSELIDYFVESEYATLKWLEKVHIPTPKAHGYGISSDPSNLVGVSYILEDAMPGKPFYAFESTPEQKSKIYSQYANILIEISQNPRQHACSLAPHKKDIVDNNIASNRFINLERHGPFNTPLEYFVSIAELHLDLIADGQIYPEYPKEAFVFYRLLRDRAAPVLAKVSGKENKFFLKHVDDKGDHLLVDDNGNITAVIDWQFARFAPASEAFGPSLFSADMSQLYGGTVGLSKDDQVLAKTLRDFGRQDLAELASLNDLARRFQFGLASGLSKAEVHKMIRAVLELLGGEDVVAHCQDVEIWVEEEWKNQASDQRQEKIDILLQNISLEQA